jgi:hypothetical protein
MKFKSDQLDIAGIDDLDMWQARAYIVALS